MDLSEKFLAKKKKIIEDYNKSAFYYDDRYREIQISKFNLLLRNIFFNNIIFLDGGCGTGLLAEYLKSKLELGFHEQLHYIGLDISIEMLLRFFSKIKDNKVLTLTHLILADISHLPFRDNLFDVIASFTSLQNLPDPINGIHELKRTSKHEAWFIVSILKKDKRLEEINQVIKSFLNHKEIILRPEIEDLMIKGQIIKNQ
ncbi:MAG: class I SAM-dependent methyltransferase [Promethearchaeota archaeon]